MSDHPRKSTEPLTARLDKICDRYEDAWLKAGSAGQRPRIEDYLEETSEAERRVLLGELIALEAAYRRQQGEEPQEEEYRQRFPGLDLTFLAQTLAAVVETSAPGASPPGFELIDEIGRGGMGVVYRARDTVLYRDVAVKLLA